MHGAPLVPRRRWGPLCSKGAPAFATRQIAAAVGLAATLLGSLAYAAAGEQPPTDTLWYRSLSVEDGLSQNFVNAIVSDRDGFMWFGTIGGLDRWNGYEFETYKHVPGTASSLSASGILTLHVDRGGGLWVGTAEGLDHFEAADNAFRRYGDLFRTRADRPVPADAITSDRSGQIWFAAFGGRRLHRLDPRTGRGRVYEIGDTDRLLVTAIHVDSRDCLWVATQVTDEAVEPGIPAYRLFAFERSSDIGDRLTTPRTPLSLDDAGGKITGIIEDRAHRVWFARNGGGLLRYDPATSLIGRVTSSSGPASLESGFVRSMTLGPSGELWVLAYAPGDVAALSAQHLHRVNPETLAVRHIELRQRELRPGDDANIERLAVDPSGVLWMGTNAGGLRYADVTAGGFSLYRKEFGTRPGLNSGFVRAICLSRKNILWVGTTAGLNRIDRSTQAVLHAGADPGGFVTLPDPSVQALHEDRAGNLWVGTRAGLVVITPSMALRRDLPVARRSGGPMGDWVQVIHEDKDGRIWLGTLGSGLVEFDPRTRSFMRHRARPGDSTSLPDNTITALFLDARGGMWVGSDVGLVRFDPAVGGARKFERVADDRDQLGGVSILSIAESTATPGMMWVGTWRGLARVSVGDQTVKFYTSRNSDLADDTVYGILSDRRGRLWMSTNRGLVCMDPVAETFRTYGADRGLQSSEFNARAHFQALDGEMFFGGVGGLNAFFPEEVSDNPNAPRLFITSVRALDRDSRRPQPPGSIYHHGMPLSAARIPYRQRDVTFDYVALHFTDPRRNRYFYKLDDYDTAWQGPVGTRGVRYTNLSPGHYTFRVRAVSSHGVASDGEAQFAFVVLPAWYATTWFRVLAGLVIAFAVGGGYRLRVRSLQRRQDDLERQVSLRTDELRKALETLEQQAQKLKELDSAKSRFFANISHEFRTPLALTLGPLRDVQSGRHGEVPQEARAEIDLAIRNTNRQLELVDQLLTLAKLDAGQLELKPRETRLDECLRLAAAAYESLARRQGTRFSIDLPDQPIPGWFDEEKLERVFSNLLDNAFKFTPPGGEVVLRLTDAGDGWAAILVEDTGPGIATKDLPHVFERFYRGEQYTGQMPGTGIGLALAKECVELHGGEIRAENRPDGGARFTVRLRTTRAVSDALAGGNVLAPDPADSTEASVAASAEEPAESGSAKVLVVEDHPDMRAYVRKHLTPHYQVLEASDGEEGLERIRTELPDVILCDVMMPRMDGYAFCRAVRSDPETDFLPVILLTAKAGFEGKLEGLEGGADDYLTKPFEPAEVLARIRNLLRSRERLKTRFWPQSGRSALAPTPLAVQSPDAVFLDRLRDILDRESQDESFDVTALTRALGTSRAQLHRRVKDTLGSTPSEVIIRFRLERAEQMLTQHAGNVGEIAYAVGFKNLSHFVKRFRDKYGRTPAAYMSACPAPPPIQAEPPQFSNT